ncbi:MAG TPA: FAD-dependent oxidoreductase, partial [Candidatus Thermoplasmatota archaeon]|nr:FAD-dependent oxidoreductase [Candidatus Thermoplasmatota archaeon]
MADAPREKIVIIGDGIAGATAAVTIRKLTQEPEITILTDEGEPLYNRVGIKDFAKAVKAEEKVKIHDLQFYDKNGVDLRLHTPVRNIDDTNKVVITEDRQHFPYDKLLIAAGGSPRRLPVPGADAENVHTFWTFVDARKLRAAAEEADTGVAIGAGLLGIDFAAVFAKHGVQTKYVMRGDRWWREGVSKQGSQIVEKALKDLGVECVFHETPKEFELDETGARATALVTEKGSKFPMDMAGVAVGLNFHTKLTQGTKIKKGEGILADSYLETSVPGVWTAGDIAQYYDVILERVHMNGSWANAKRQGEVAGLNIAGQKTEFRFVDIYSVDHFDFMVGSVGSVVAEWEIEGVIAENSYLRLVGKGNRLVGAAVTGKAFVLQGHIKRLVFNKTDVSGVKDQMVQ